MPWPAGRGPAREAAPGVPAAAEPGPGPAPPTGSGREEERPDRLSWGRADCGFVGRLAWRCTVCGAGVRPVALLLGIGAWDSTAALHVFSTHTELATPLSSTHDEVVTPRPGAA